jgi:hypothetical protein
MWLPDNERLPTNMKQMMCTVEMAAKPKISPCLSNRGLATYEKEDHYSSLTAGRVRTA